jgi:hypothetical protein
MDQPPPAIPPEQLALLASEDHGPRTIGIVIAFTVLAFLSVILRFVTRTRLTHLVGWEDYLIALAMVFPAPGHGENILFTYVPGLFDRYISMSSQASGMGCWQTPNLCRSSFDHQQSKSMLAQATPGQLTVNSSAGKFLLTGTVPLFEHSYLRSWLHFCEALHPDAVSTNILGE